VKGFCEITRECLRTKCKGKFLDLRARMAKQLHTEGIRNPYTLTDVIMGISHKLDEMDWACCTHTRDGKCVQNFSLETSREEAVRETV
jgi:hypothetical protein